MRTSPRHVISALRFSRLTVVFLIAQTVLACAFLSNAVSFIVHQAAPMLAKSGVASGQVLYVDGIAISTTANSKTGALDGGVTSAELQVLESRIRALSGVEAVSVDIGMPFTSEFTGSLAVYAMQAGTSTDASIYLGDHLATALGLRLVRGRYFRPDEIVAMGMGDTNFPAVIVSAAIAQRLFPDGHALGQPVALGKGAPPSIIVGIVRHLATRQPVDAIHANAAVIAPAIPGPGFPELSLVVRTQPAARAQVAHMLPALVKTSLHLQAGAPLPNVRTFEALHDAYFRPNRSMIWLMLAVTLAVVVITVIGIMGLTGFWVQRRTRTIAIRRALGATRADILRYFLLENLLVVGTGSVLGALAAWCGNLWLITHLAIPRLPLSYLLIGAVAICVIGQLAVVAQALRASSAPPAITMKAT